MTRFATAQASTSSSPPLGLGDPAARSSGRSGSRVTATPASPASAARRPPPPAVTSAAPPSPARPSPATPSTACLDPAPRALASRVARHSPFQALRAYIGGANASCAQPNLDASLGRAGDRRRLGPDPDLCRAYAAPGASQWMRADLVQPSRGGGHGRRRERRRRGEGARTRSWNPNLRRHRGLLPDVEEHVDGARVPGRMDDRAARVGLRVRRLRLERLGDRQPGAGVRHRLRRAR